MAQSPAHIKASAKYNAKAYDMITVQVKKGTKEKLQQQAINQGVSLNAYIKEVVTLKYKADTGEEINL